MALARRRSKGTYGPLRRDFKRCGNLIKVDQEGAHEYIHLHDWKETKKSCLCLMEKMWKSYVQDADLSSIVGPHKSLMNP